jgi:ribosomal protein S18 acetylase RimI-like enzyme
MIVVKSEIPDILPLARRHITEAVRLHMRAFPGFFLTFMGSRFLAEFYRAFLSEPTAVAVIAENDAGCVCGAAVGALNPAGFFKRLLLRRWWAFCLTGMTAVVRQPAIVPRLFRAVRYRGESPPGEPRALLSSIAVAPEAQGKGVGRLLVERWVAEARARGARGCFLTTDADNNEAVNAFYRKLGWTVESTHTTPEGRRMNRYVLDF